MERTPFNKVSLFLAFKMATNITDWFPPKKIPESLIDKQKVLNFLCLVPFKENSIRSPWFQQRHAVTAAPAPVKNAFFESGDAFGYTRILSLF